MSENKPLEDSVNVSEQKDSKQNHSGHEQDESKPEAKVLPKEIVLLSNLTENPEINADAECLDEFYSVLKKTFK